ncbi:MAG TPA: UbiA family prenyltransferase [Tepidisphaeraceae bacterium]|jgi:4-hydroxybenzoate polyprenyltransferase
MKPPLYVDLDGTLIRSDTMQQASMQLLRDSPIKLIRAGWAILRDRTAAKRILAENVDLDVEHFPYRQAVIDYIKQAKADGRRVVLATGSHRKYAEAAALHVGLFDAVYSTDNGPNLIGSHKLEQIRKDAGPDGFEYLGDSGADLVIFENAHTAGMVGGRRFKPLANAKVQSHRLAHIHNNEVRDQLRLIRPHQWVKNLLIVLPVLASHRWNEWPVIWATLLTIVAFSLVASGNYILNDLFDIDRDRRHPIKRNRPVASGAVTIIRAMYLSAALLIAGLLLGWLIHVHVLYVLLGYLSLAHLYSVQLKRRLLVDVIALAGMYTIRVIAGSVATGITPSPWLLSFCMFFFACIAFAKRYTELRGSLDLQPDTNLPGRGYQPQDLDIIRVVGPVNGYLAVLVTALYISSPDVTKLYEQPHLLWLICPILAYWVTRLWFFAHRGVLHHDPVVFALTDWKSHAAILLTVVIIVLASIPGIGQKKTNNPFDIPVSPDAGYSPSPNANPTSPAPDPPALPAPPREGA